MQSSYVPTIEDMPDFGKDIFVGTCLGCGVDDMMFWNEDLYLVHMCADCMAKEIRRNKNWTVRQSIVRELNMVKNNIKAYSRSKHKSIDNGSKPPMEYLQSRIDFHNRLIYKHPSHISKNSRKIIK